MNPDSGSLSQNLFSWRRSAGAGAANSPAAAIGTAVGVPVGVPAAAAAAAQPPRCRRGRLVGSPVDALQARKARAEELRRVKSYSQSRVSPYVKVVAGMAGGVVEACCLQPLDVSKTRLQARVCACVCPGFAQVRACVRACVRGVRVR